MPELYDLDFDGFLDLVREIEGQGYGEATAARYACLIGDTPATDEHGNVLVMDGDKVIAKLKPLECLGCEEKPAYIVGDAVPTAVAGQVGQLLADAYDSTFGNFDEIALPEFIFEDRFTALLAMALKRGQPLTQAEVTTVFPSAAWEY